MLFRRAVCVSIDGVTIMINVNRKKQTPTIKQAQMCTGTKQPRCCLAVAATVGSLPGAAPSAPRGGMGQDHRPVSSLARPFLTLWNELLRCRIWSLPNHAACAPQQRLGRLKGWGASGTSSSRGSTRAGGPKPCQSHCDFAKETEL